MGKDGKPIRKAPLKGTLFKDALVCLCLAEAQDFSSLKVLGKGSFGVVHLVRRQGTEEVYALKQIRKEHYRNKNRMKALWLNVELPLSQSFVHVTELSRYIASRLEAIASMENLQFGGG